MSYTPNIPLTLDSDFAGLASDLRGQLYDGATQAPVGVAISGVFFERPGAQAMYIMRPTIPDGHDGWCDIYVDGAPETVIGFFSINPAELDARSIADELLRRGRSHSDNDAEEGSLYEAIGILTQAITLATVLRIYKSDGVTTFNERTLTLDDTAQPVTGIA